MRSPSQLPCGDNNDDTNGGYTWQTGSWSPCSTIHSSHNDPCKGVQTRPVKCADSSGVAVDDAHFCGDKTPPPPSMQICSSCKIDNHGGVPIARVPILIESPHRSLDGEHTPGAMYLHGPMDIPILDIPVEMPSSLLTMPSQEEEGGVYGKKNSGISIFGGVSSMIISVISMILCMILTKTQ